MAQNGLFLPAAPASSKRGAVTGRSQDPAHRQLVRPPWAGPVHPVALLDCALGLWLRLSCSAGIWEAPFWWDHVLHFPAALQGFWGLLSGGRGCLAFGQAERCSGSGEGTGLFQCGVCSSASGFMGR